MTERGRKKKQEEAMNSVWSLAYIEIHLRTQGFPLATKDQYTLTGFVASTKGTLITALLILLTRTDSVSHT